MKDKAFKEKSLQREDVIFPHVKAEHRWGYKDTKFILKDNGKVTVSGSRYPVSGYEMARLIPFANEVLQHPFSDIKRPEMEVQLPPPKRNKLFVSELQKEHKNRLSFEDKERLIHSHGQTTADEVMKVLYCGGMERYADAVFYCIEEEEVFSIVTLAQKYNVCLVPYGGGTSVSSSLTLPTNEKRMIVVVDTSRLTKILSLDTNNHYVTVQSGITGETLEQFLKKSGYTTGHEPDSIEFSTVGGWIATNASGMKKNRYGNIEDIVDRFTMVTPKGIIESQHMFPRTSSGMQISRLLFGSEGNVGIITRATLKIRKVPKQQGYESIIFKDFSTGIQFLKDMKDLQTYPASIRLMDNIQFRFGQALKAEAGFLKKIVRALQIFILKVLKRFNLKKMSAATIVFEGTKEEVVHQKTMMKKLAKKYNGVFGGGSNGKLGYALTYAIAYIRDFFLDYYILGETYETTVLWNDIEKVCDALQKKHL
ncbi:alkyldihydroxyacetonephosphate synthase, peroxisomal-like [Ylistrum balloti]|uniref:alkyldihydroxyacetonephosphate synthase, peroxisomal-like n=1 Tax=Ylistrum balloti TaxID=509963 RepID=UPI002905EE21|nr:alkyldihydroxyacetonephosphate synthase, peroxisomal-like [Ylistrum balloti]